MARPPASRAPSIEGALDALLPEVFARTVAAHPERTALDIPPGSDRPLRVRWTYAELARRVDLLTDALAPHVAPEGVVAIFLPRTNPDLFAAQLAVLRVGAAFTAIDPSAPDAHVRFVIADSHATCLVGDAATLGRLPADAIGGDRRVDVSADVSADDSIGARDQHPTGRVSRLPASPTPRGLAYVIYTSGTTGTPKGVLIEHASIANLVASDVEYFRLGPEARVVQGSSAAYDSSLEETWLAFAAGATVVVMDEETSRLGPDLPAWLVAERITVFCPPPTLLRTTGLEDPRTALPELSLLYVGGEALERDVSDRWASGRRLENGYGPTECTVTVLRTRVREGEPVTIGRPLRGHRAYALDERLEEVADGEPGELCIEGAGVARGYLDRPELTAERFPTHPRLGRLYRTGDLVRRQADGAFVYFGRIDEQVKIRGHRIELGAVESALAALAGVREAACRVQPSPSGPVLAAFVVASDPAHPPTFDDLAPRLAERLPAPMIPSRFQVIAALPMLPSGKLDRKALPEIAAADRVGHAPIVVPADELEGLVAEAFRATLGREAPVSAADDFFLALGGDSVGAAQVISRLRRDPRTVTATVRDLYAGRTVQAFAARVRAAGAQRASPAIGSLSPRSTGPRSTSPFWFTVAQTLWLAAGLVLVGGLVYLNAFFVAPYLFARMGVVGAVLSTPIFGLLLAIVYAPIAVLVTVAAKGALIGRFVPLRAPVFGVVHLRHWMVERVAQLIPWSLLENTIFLGIALRALGARVGRDVHVHGSVDLRRGGWDLLTLDDQASLGQEVALRLVSIDAGEFVVGPVTIGAGATLETRAGVEAHTEIGAGASLAPLSWLSSGVSIPLGERFEGVPARSVGRTPPRPVRSIVAPTRTPLVHGVLTLVSRFGRWIPFSLAFAACSLLLGESGFFDGAQLVRGLLDPFGEATGFERLAFLVVLATPLASIASAIGLRFMGRVEPGVFPCYSAAYLRIVAKTEAVTRAGLLWSGSLFWPMWLRLAGMRIGRRCEISTIVDVVPECVSVGDETFLADGIYLGGPRVREGDVEIGSTSLGSRDFIGNHAVIPTGCRLEDDVLVGVATVADGERMRTGTSWFGHPAFELPRVASLEFDRRLTHEPSLLRVANRVFWEASRVFLPIPPLLVAGLWLHAVDRARAGASPFAMLGLWVPLATLGATGVLVALSVALKWLLLGRVKPGRHALWSCWASRWDFFYMAWDVWARRALAVLEGTLLLGFVLRATGMRIGRRVVLGRGCSQVVDPDMLTIEDDATVHALFQAHSFEDRVLKMDRVHIGRGASVGEGAVIFYGATIGDGAYVAPHSVVMKHEHLAPGRSYVGCPTEAEAAPDAVAGTAANRASDAGPVRDSMRRAEAS